MKSKLSYSSKNYYKVTNGTNVIYFEINHGHDTRIVVSNITNYMRQKHNNNLKDVITVMLLNLSKREIRKLYYYVYKDVSLKDPLKLKLKKLIQQKQLKG